jgi:hypothetical protein
VLILPDRFVEDREAFLRVKSVKRFQHPAHARYDRIEIVSHINHVANEAFAQKRHVASDEKTDLIGQGHQAGVNAPHRPKTFNNILDHIHLQIGILLGSIGEQDDPVKDGFHHPGNSIDQSYAADLNKGFVAPISGALAAEKDEATHVP